MWTKKYVTSVAVITMAILAIGGILWNSGTAELKPNTDSTGVTSWHRGDEGALITIDVYTDFECHICVKKELIVVEALGVYPGKIRMAYHHYPSSGFSEKLAEALEAAGEQGKFWEMHDRLIQNVPADMAMLKDLAKEVGLDMKRFNEALDSGKFTEKVQWAKELAILQGIKHVSLYINGKEYEKNSGMLEDLRTAIDEELERLGANVSD